MTRLSALVMFLAALCPAVALGHPVHATLAELEHNKKSGMLEIALWINPGDLERALSERVRVRVVLEKTPKVDAMILDLLRAYFLVRGADGKRKTLQWVGKEIKVKATWLYFQIPFKGPLEGVRISNLLFLKSLPRQINTINVKDGKRKATVHCTRHNPRRTVRFKKAKKAAAGKPSTGRIRKPGD